MRWYCFSCWMNLHNIHLIFHLVDLLLCGKPPQLVGMCIQDCLLRNNAALWGLAMSLWPGATSFLEWGGGRVHPKVSVWLQVQFLSVFLKALLTPVLHQRGWSVLSHFIRRQRVGGKQGTFKGSPVPSPSQCSLPGCLQWVGPPVTTSCLSTIQASWTTLYLQFLSLGFVLWWAWPWTCCAPCCSSSPGPGSPTCSWSGSFRMWDSDLPLPI